MTAEMINAETGEIIQTEQAFSQLTPAARIELAVQIANLCGPIIEERGLFANIQGKKYVTVDGWLLVGTMLGLRAVERHVAEQEDGAWVAHIDLVDASGALVGSASALCGRDEDKWKKAKRYALRSMATTRAVGKAFRTHVPYIIKMAGYEPTPSEEMPDERDEFVAVANPHPIRITQEMADDVVVRPSSSELDYVLKQIAACTTTEGLQVIGQKIKADEAFNPDEKAQLRKAWAEKNMAILGIGE